ncbi:MAG TPA: aspartyl protease family protein [Gemmatimonadota bacterium]|nr:aspartyl protease family protein [Gemmatimonadota bacterium]
MIASAAAAQEVPRAVDDSLAAALRAADAALRAGRSDEAIEGYRRAQALLGIHLTYARPDRFYYEEGAAIHRGLARAYLDAGDAHAARVEAERGLNLDPEDSRLLAALGGALYRSGEPAAARAALEAALAREPDLAEAHWALGRVEIAGNRLEPARARAGRALELEARPRYARDFARYSALAGDHGSAARALRTWERLAPASAERDTLERLRAFYEASARERLLRMDRPVVRAQVNFDLVPGDEVPYVPVRFADGETVYVLFDTGAGWNVIDRDFARSIGVDPIWPGASLVGALGSSPGGYGIVPRMEIGGLEIGAVPFVVGDFEALRLRGRGAYRIAAVVNPALLFRDHTVVFDYRHRRIEIHRFEPGSPGYAERATRQRKTATPFLFDANGVWPVLLVRIDGSRELPFVLDTGASDVLIDRATASALRVSPAGIVVEVGEHLTQGIRPLLLDGRPGVLEGIEVRGILGFPFFRDKRLAFDYRSMVLTVED